MTDHDAIRRQLLEGIGRVDDPATLAPRLAERLLAAPGRRDSPAWIEAAGLILADALAEALADFGRLRARADEAREAAGAARVSPGRAEALRVAATLWDQAAAVLVARAYALRPIGSRAAEPDPGLFGPDGPPNLDDFAPEARDVEAGAAVLEAHARYLRHKALAMRYRQVGMIDRALAEEAELKAIYDRLPSWGRW